MTTTTNPRWTSCSSAWRCANPTALLVSSVCLQGVVIALSCIIFSAISSSPPAVDTGASVVTAVWTYVGELAFNLLVLVGAIKGCDRIVKEIMGL